MKKKQERDYRYVAAFSQENMWQRVEKYLLTFCNIAAVIFFVYIAFFLFYLAGCEVMNWDAALTMCCAKNFAWGKNFVTGYPPYYYITTGGTMLLPAAAGIRFLGNGLAVPHFVMLTVNLLLLIIIFILTFKYHFIAKKYWGIYSLVFLLFYFLFPCSDRAAVWFYTPLGELPTVLYLQIGVLILFSDFNRDRISRRKIFASGVCFGSALLCKDLGLLPLIVICGSWFWLRFRCLPQKNWRKILDDAVILLCGILLLPFLWQVLLFCNLGCSVSIFWQEKVHFFTFFQNMSAQSESFWEHLSSRFSYYRIVDGILWASFMALFPLYLAIRFLFVKVYEKRFYAWTLFWAGYSVYCYWLFCDALNHSRRLLMGHIFFVSAAAVFLFVSEKKWVKLLLLLLIAFNPQFRNAFNDLTCFDRKDFLQESAEVRKTVEFCMEHPEASYVEAAYGRGPYLISYAHPEKNDILTHGNAGTEEKTYCILEVRYLSYYRKHIPPYARCLNPENKFWRIYDFSAPPALPPKSVAGDIDGDGMSEILVWHKNSGGDVVYHIYGINGKEKCSSWKMKPEMYFTGTADTDLDGQEELFFHHTAKENAPENPLFTVSAKNSYQIASYDISTPLQHDSCIYSGFWNGYGNCFVGHHVPSQEIVLLDKKHSPQNIPGHFSSVWKLVAMGLFGKNNIHHLLFYCSQLNNYYLFDLGGKYREMPVRLLPLACGPDTRWSDTVFFKLPEKKGVMTMSQKIIPVPDGWHVAAAGYYKPDAPLPQLLLVQQETGKTALWTGEEKGTFTVLDWKIEKDCHIWNRVFSEETVLPTR